MAESHGEAWVSAAQTIATEAHAGQTDKAGLPYIDHPRRVAEGFPESDYNARIVGWLHDVVEDTAVTLTDLLEAGFGQIIVDAVDAISRRPREWPESYYSRVLRNELARRVKVADVADNSDPARLALLDEPTRLRLEAKYGQARAVLTRDVADRIARQDLAANRG